MKLDTAANLLNTYLVADIPAFLWGAPGIGKSDIVRAAARTEGLPIIDLRAILLDPVDLRGLPMVHDGAAKWAKPDFLPDAARDGERGLLFLDELNAAPPSVQAACFQLVFDRKLGEYTLPAGWRIVAAGNRQSDRAAAQRMASALGNRFGHIDCEVCPAAWRNWAESVGLHPAVIAFISYRNELLHKMDGSDLRAFPTPRSWAAVAKVADASPAIRPHAVAGLVGDGAAAEFEGFMRTWQRLPPIADILNNPGGAIVPGMDEPGLLYAVSIALMRKMEPGNAAAVITYLERMPSPEFAVMAITGAAKRDARLDAVSAVTDWRIRNSKVTG